MRPGSTGALVRGLQTPLTVPLEVNVVLLGLGGDGGYRYTLDHEGLARLLRASCYTHRPACLDSGEHLMLRHRVFFNVIKVLIQCRLIQ